MGEFIIGIIVDFVLAYPGGFIRWCVLKLFNSKVALKECVGKDISQNAAIAAVFYGIIAVSVNYASK